MKKSSREIEYNKSVTNKFSIYNSLFLSLPFQKISNIGILIPLLNHECRKGLEAGKEPLEILDNFFRVHTTFESEEEKIDFMFRVIQFVERQIVLFDSAEDAAFAQLLKDGDYMSFPTCIEIAEVKKITPFLIEKMSDFSVRIVFTAHPTQFYPRTVLDIIEKLRVLVRGNKVDEIDRTLQQLGMTSIMNLRKPTPLTEAKNIIYFLRSVYYDAVGELYSHIKENVPSDSFENPELIQLGFWPGGDRDGNPYVTAEVTGQVADELRMTLMKCYYHELKGLEQKLTFRKIEDLVAELKAKLYVCMFDPEKSLSTGEILSPLSQVKQLLRDNCNGLYMADLEAFIDKVKIFKTHFATLDIRQNHGEHENVIIAILKKEKRIQKELGELSKEALVEILLHENFDVRADQFTEEITRDTIATITGIKSIQEKNGEAGCNRYIISNSEDIFSVLFVFALLRWCGWKNEQIPVDIVPLFESMDGMKHAESIMQELFEFPLYRSHVRYRGDRQNIMLGFSDGTKDGGYLQANWSIFKTKEVLSTICSENGIKAIFFDGRGGPPARGGGRTHRFYASQSRRIANHAIQLTIQGQTITSQYGTRAHFTHNCEQLLTAGLAHILSGEEVDIYKKSREIIERLATISFEKYVELKNHEQFLPYLENKSTLKYYSMANIGSRPAKRGKTAKLTLQDLRAISFVGSWSQMRQNVPGYFGIGTALKEVADDVGIGMLQEIYREVPFFKALLLNSMMSMSKCYFELTAYIQKDEQYKEFWNILFEEFELSKQMVLLVSENHYLMEEEPISHQSIKIRENIVLPLLAIQQYAFQKIEGNTTHQKSYEKMIHRSLYGNINASRNSA